MLRFFHFTKKGRRSAEKTDQKKKTTHRKSALARAYSLVLYTHRQRERERERDARAHKKEKRHAERATTTPPSVLARAHAAFERGFFAGRAEGNFTQSWISNVRFFFFFPRLFFLSLRACFFCARDADDLRLSLSLSLSLCACVRVSQIAGTSEVF